ncbi:MAG: OmpA family protein [Gillisia sp.]
MLRICLAILILASSFTSCVSSKVYNDLQSKYDKEQEKNASLNSELQQERAENLRKISELKDEYAALSSQKEELQKKIEDLQKDYQDLQNSYDALDKTSSSALSENSKRNRQLLAELEEKENNLVAEQQRLEKLEKDLNARGKRIDELEGIIAAKDAKMNALKNAVSDALTNFEGKGLTVEQRNGKVYVSMENKLLFDSGSWAVNKDGKEAVEQLGQVLAQNPDISVLIEGHTDNVPYGGKGELKDNWDLSTKRATAIVHILQENKGIDAQNLTAAGRGEFAPVASNETPEGRAKNRRIEVILTPKLDEISRALNEM